MEELKHGKELQLQEKVSKLPVLERGSELFSQRNLYELLK